jgi:hypothetical protein
MDTVYMWSSFMHALQVPAHPQPAHAQRFSRYVLQQHAWAALVIDWDCR